MGCQVLTTTSVKIIAFSKIEPCGQEEVDRRFITLTMELEGTYEMPDNFYESTKHNIAENCKLLNNRCLL